jgi:L-ribulose-5-phosphate 4-epimerase
MNEEEDLKEKVAKLNRDLISSGLVFMTFGNASAIDIKKQFIYIKPSGVDSKNIIGQQIVKVGIDGTNYSDLKPSVDTNIHLELYKSFPEIKSIIHTHSTYATAFAQKNIPIPCFGTTHADYFFGNIPVTRALRDEEIDNDYESNIGKVIVETFNLNKLSHLKIPACLVASHGPFVWGETMEQALENSIALEKIAKLAYLTLSLQGNISTIPKQSLITKHFLRKHGPQKYYGQDKLI